MDAIVEVHDEKELERALALRRAIIGINNRDLKTLKTDLSVTERLAPLVPAGVLAIAESGIAARKDVDRLAPSVDAFLVGSALMAASDTGQAARALVHGRVKLCGLTNALRMCACRGHRRDPRRLHLRPGSARDVTARRGPIWRSRPCRGMKASACSAMPIGEVIRTAGIGSTRPAARQRGRADRRAARKLAESRSKSGRLRGQRRGAAAPRRRPQPVRHRPTAAAAPARRSTGRWSPTRGSAGRFLAGGMAPPMPSRGGGRRFGSTSARGRARARASRTRPKCGLVRRAAARRGARPC
jgi:hypothetical protein